MMERADSSQKLYTRMRLWEFPDQYVVEPTDGSCGSSLAISRKDGSMNLIGTLILLAVLCPGFCSICCVLFSGVNCECLLDGPFFCHLQMNFQTATLFGFLKFGLFLV